MKWSPEAEAAVKKVPFFVRKKVRSKIEARAQETGEKIVTLEVVESAKKRFISKMEEDIKGYQLESCFGPSGCPHQANSCETLMDKVKALLEKEELLSFLKNNVDGPLKYHHEFRVAAADCPNSCSQPQIKDVGITGAVLPEIDEQDCNLCGDCCSACPDKAIAVDPGGTPPATIDYDACQMCGQCIDVCQLGAIKEKQRGYRMQLGGRLGRHPRLAIKIPEILNENQVLRILKECLQFYKTHSKNGQRFSKIITQQDVERISIKHAVNY